MNATSEPSLQKLISSTRFIEPSMPCEDVMKYFEHYKTQSIVVVDKGKPIGFLSYKKTADALSNRYGYALYQKRPVTELMLKDFLVVRVDSKFTDVVQWALARQSDSVYEDIVVVDKDGQYIGLISIDRVLKEQRIRILQQLEELETSRNELAAVNAQLQQALKELKTREEQLLQTEKMASIGTLASGIAHDFNNMLSVILSGIHMIKKNLNPQQHSVILQYCNSIENAGKRSATLVRQLLDFSQKNIMNKKVLSLNDVILETTHILERSIGKEIKVELSLDANIPSIEADETQLQQIIMNLALNARDAMPQGGTLKLSTAVVTLNEVEVRQYPRLKAGSYVQLKVEDTGVGIPSEILHRIFEPFFTTKPVGKGTGLGLAVVYGIASRHGAHIDVQSKVGKGTTFTLFFPPYITDAIPTKQDKKMTDEEFTGKGKILLVDDEELVLTVNGDFLTSLGYTILKARSGDEAIDIYRNGWKEIDLVILDMVMPGKNGRDTFYELKSINNNVKVLIASGYTSEQSTREMIRNGAVAFVQKPFDHGEFSKLLHRLMYTVS